MRDELSSSELKLIGDAIEYPYIVADRDGFKVYISPKIKLVGVFLTRLRAEKALQRHIAESNIAREKSKLKYKERTQKG